MNKLVGLSGMMSLDKFKSLSGFNSGTAKTLPISSRASSDSVSSGSFANLKLTAEKLVKEQASAKTDLDLANSKMKKLTEHLHLLEEKLQNAFNENAKLKVKQKEDEKLWRGLESKFSSTKTLCDQLTETLQYLAGQVQDAEKDKVYFEDKLSATSVTLDNLHDLLKSMTLRLNSSEQTLLNREEELKKLGNEKEEMAKLFRDENCRFTGLVEEKDAMIKNLQETVAANGSSMEGLNSKLEELHLELRTKEDDFKNLTKYKDTLETAKIDLLSSNEELASRLDMAIGDIKDLEVFIELLAAKLRELDNQSLTFSDHVLQLTASFDASFKLLHEKSNLAAQLYQKKIDQLRDYSLLVKSEKDALEQVNEELKHKVSELQKEQEYAMLQHAEECRLVEEKVRRLESEEENLISKKTEMEVLITKLQEKIDQLSEALRLSNKDMQDLSMKHSDLEMKKKDDTANLQEEVQKKDEELNNLRKDMGMYEQRIDSLEKEVSQLNSSLEEKDQLVLQYKDGEKQLEDQKAEIQALLADVESKLKEAKREYDQMLETKQLELSKHLKEISQRNDQAINDMRRKYEKDKLESINLEKEKAEKATLEMERKCDQKLAECKEESRQYMMRVQTEHAALISRIQQEHDKKELGIISTHQEEMKRFQIQAENELREKTMSIKNEHEAQLRALRTQHETECRELQEELDIQKTKEERQRALLQLQWKVMGDNPEEDQEVTSKKNYTMSSSKMRNPEGNKRGERVLVRAEDEEKDAPYLRASQTPVSNLMKKVDVNSGSVMNIPKHSRKVTHHEYEVETSNGRTITKRRKTKRTVMFQDPEKHKKRGTPKASTPMTVVKGIKRGGPPNPSNIGDLFSEGSLNPYADDPYAFD